MYEFFNSRIDYEREQDRAERYGDLLRERQKGFEFFAGLARFLPNRVTRWLSKGAEDLLTRSRYEQVGQRRFFKIVGDIRIPLP